MYTFEGVSRLQLLFRTPNECGVVLAMLLMLSNGVFLLALELKITRQWRRILQIVAALLVFASMVLVAKTFSRGAYLGVVVAYATLAISVAKFRKHLLGLLLAFLIVLVLTPHGLGRINTIVNVRQDLSIAHRIELWRGALAILHDFGKSGVGFPAFGEVYTAWYQAESRHEAYRTAVSDLLTIGACAGYVGLSVYIFVAFLLVCEGLCLVHITKSPLIIALVGGVIAYIVSALTSTFILRLPVALPALVLGVALIIWVLTRREAPVVNSHARAKAAFSALGLTICTSAAFGIAAKWSADAYAYRPMILPAMLNGGGKMSACLVEPRHAAPTHVAIFVEERWFLPTDARSVLCRLASAGYAVYAVRPSDFDRTGIAECTNCVGLVHARYPLPMLLMGHGEGGRIAALLADGASSDFDGLVLIGANCSWPVPRFSPLGRAKQIHCPVYILHGAKDKQADPQYAADLYRALPSSDRSVCHIYPEGDHFLIAEAADIVARVVVWVNSRDLIK